MKNPIAQCQLCFLRELLLQRKAPASLQNSFIWYCKIVKFNVFELRIFSFNSCVYYLTHGFITSTRAFNLLTRAFNLPTHAFNLGTRAYSPLTRGFELVTHGFQPVTRNSCFTFPRNIHGKPNSVTFLKLERMLILSPLKS